MEIIEIDFAKPLLNATDLNESKGFLSTFTATIKLNDKELFIDGISGFDAEIEIMTNEEEEIKECDLMYFNTTIFEVELDEVAYKVTDEERQQIINEIENYLETKFYE